MCCVFERVCKALCTRMLVSFCGVQLINMSNLAVKFYKLPDKILISYSTVNCDRNLNECRLFFKRMWYSEANVNFVSTDKIYAWWKWMNEWMNRLGSNVSNDFVLHFGWTHTNRYVWWSMIYCIFYIQSNSIEKGNVDILFGLFTLSVQNWS